MIPQHSGWQQLGVGATQRRGWRPRQRALDNIYTAILQPGREITAPSPSRDLDADSDSELESEDRLENSAP